QLGRVLGGQLAQALDEQRHVGAEVGQRGGALGDTPDLVEGGGLGRRIDGPPDQGLDLRHPGLFEGAAGEVGVLPEHRAAGNWRAIWPVFLPSLNHEAWTWSKLSR